MELDIKRLEKVALSVRTLTIDAIEKAKSGHPGMVLGLAEFGSLLFGEILKHNPEDPDWLGRDRFILSAGHGSMLLYSLLFLSGYNYTKEDIINFRQLNSKTPGHPEVHFDGVEASTGPLGQGFGNSVGMALANKIMAGEFNTEKHKIFGSNFFVVVGDGDLMEGVVYEAASLAGHWKLDNMFVFYDSNKITIEGPTNITFTENVKERFRAQGWYVDEVDGYDWEGMLAAYKKAKNVKDKPHLIVLNTVIGKCSRSKSASESAHGAPLGVEDACNTKCDLGVGSKQFYVDDQALEYFKEKREIFKNGYDKWQTMFKEWANENPPLKKKYDSYFNEEMNEAVFDVFPYIKDCSKKIATRVAIKDGLKILAAKYTNIIGGSADLGSSCGSVIAQTTVVQHPLYHGRHLQYGVREHAMGAISTGIELHGGFKVFCGTFFAFANYMIPSMRMASIMKRGVNYYFSHDSVYVGEDGPSHQPIENIHQLRLTPGVFVFRPADINETYIAMGLGLLFKNNPTVIITTRQAVDVIDRTQANVLGYENVKKGGYIIYSEDKSKPISAIIIATGSEVANSIQAAKKLNGDGLNVRVVNMCCCELFDRQTEEYKESVLPKSITKRVAVEASHPDYWYKYVGIGGDVIGVSDFGVSGYFEEMTAIYGFDSESIAKRVKKLC